MSHVNIEMKARCDDPDRMRRVLKEDNADFKGTDHQVDTYFKVPKGRLKLREGTIEGSLIHYDRPDQEGPKQSDVTLFDIKPGSGLKEVLIKSLDVLVIVDKQREIYFLENVKFHIDQVKDLGSFVEIEAIDTTGEIGIEKLKEQCDYYINRLSIQPEDFLSQSYSDIILAEK